MEVDCGLILSVESEKELRCQDVVSKEEVRLGVLLI